VEPYADSIIKIEYIGQQVGLGGQAVKTKYAYIDLSLVFIWN